jgi:nucleoside-diphosphate-sugar epimerase
MRILIIGGTRFIGPRVARILVHRGHEVAVFHRGQHQASLPASVRRFEDPRAAMPVTRIPDTLREYQPEIVLHMVAMGQRDAEAAVEAFAGIARRIVAPSSGDVYRAYGIFKGLEDAPVQRGLLSESSPLRTTFFPYKTHDTPLDALECLYDKMLVEKALSADARMPATILRLPKVYGPGDNANLATVYGYRNHPGWRWTHGYVGNVAKAIAFAILDERASGRTYNVGEAITPTVAERLAYLPDRPSAPLLREKGNFAQNIAYDTSRIREELGYREAIDERAAMIETARRTP